MMNDGHLFRKWYYKLNEFVKKGLDCLEKVESAVVDVWAGREMFVFHEGLEGRD